MVVVLKGPSLFVMALEVFINFLKHILMVTSSNPCYTTLIFLHLRHIPQCKEKEQTENLFGKIEIVQEFGELGIRAQTIAVRALLCVANGCSCSSLYWAGS